MLPAYLPKLNALAKDGHLACGKLTWADFFFASFKDLYKWSFDFELLAPYPNLQAVVAKVTAIPAIEKWLKERPPMMF